MHVVLNVEFKNLLYMLRIYSTIFLTHVGQHIRQQLFPSEVLGSIGKCTIQLQDHLNLVVMVGNKYEVCCRELKEMYLYCRICENIGPF